MLGHVAVAVLLAACGDASSGGSAPVSKIAGPPAQVLPFAVPASVQVVTTQSVRVRVTDATNIPVPGASIGWSVVKGDAMVSPTSTVSDDNGLTATSLTLGEKAGSVTVRATFGTGLTRDFDVAALPGPLAELTPLYTDLSVRAGTTFTGTIRAVDAYGNGIPGVVLTSLAGEVQYTDLVTTPTDPPARTTDATGSATFTGTTTALPGVQTFLIDGPHQPGLVGGFNAWFRVRATADKGYLTTTKNQVTTATLTRGNAWTIGVVVIGADGAPAVGAPVQFVVAAGNGAVVAPSGASAASVTTVTDSYSGFASAQWQPPPTPGTYALTVSTPAPNDSRGPLTFTLKVTP